VMSVVSALACQCGSPRPWLKHGTVLLRDYQGHLHTVTVAPDVFDWQGTTYASVSAIARAITGTGWSGHRFFALAPRNGTSARGNTKRSVRGDRTGSQPTPGLSKGISLALANSVSCVTPEP